MLHWKKQFSFTNLPICNFEKLITGVNENFTKRNISLLEFIDYYDSYKETCIQLHEIKKDVFLAMENLNTTIGQNILNY